jgi:hypothetical protein
MRTIKVFASPDEAQYSSFTEAISASKRNPRSTAAEQITKEVKGANVLGFAFGPTWLDLVLAGQRILHIFLNDGIVGWELNNNITPRSISKADQRDNLYLEFTNNGTTYYWDRSGVLNGLVGKAVRMLSASQSWLFLTVEGMPTLMFSRLKIIDAAGDLLHFGPE